MMGPFAVEILFCWGSSLGCGLNSSHVNASTLLPMDSSLHCVLMCIRENQDLRRLAARAAAKAYLDLHCPVSLNLTATPLYSAALGHRQTLARTGQQGCSWGVGLTL